MKTVSSIIKAGGTAIYPSDTVYGIIADSANRTACEKVARMKGYPSTRPFIILIPSVESALTHTNTSNTRKTEVLMQQHWPGPVTLVFKASTSVPEWLISKEGTVALRLPEDQLSQDLLRETGLFLITTSANRKGQPFPLAIQEIIKEILNSTDCVLDAGPCTGRKPSTVIDCTGDLPFEVRH